ncbi:MAG: hypothetical protein RIB52_03375 [Erythrobacter sp.]|uniref:hypothetical protein n=1 Tax=Erythrobacter sp. TaxID=1042 RepID=UPI0032ED598A
MFRTIIAIAAIAGLAVAPGSAPARAADDSLTREQAFAGCLMLLHLRDGLDERINGYKARMKRDQRKADTYRSANREYNKDVERHNGLVRRWRLLNAKVKRICLKVDISRKVCSSNDSVIKAVGEKSCARLR